MIGMLAISPLPSLILLAAPAVKDRHVLLHEHDVEALRAELRDCLLAVAREAERAAELHERTCRKVK
jgi:hypothetical protein